VRPLEELRELVAADPFGAFRPQPGSKRIVFEDREGYEPLAAATAGAGW